MECGEGEAMEAITPDNVIISTQEAILGQAADLSDFFPSPSRGFAEFHAVTRYRDY